MPRLGDTEPEYNLKLNLEEVELLKQSLFIFMTRHPVLTTKTHTNLILTLDDLTTPKIGDNSEGIIKP